MHWIPRGALTCVQGSVEDVVSPDWDGRRFKREAFHNVPASLPCLRTLNVILIHENPTLFYVCVDPGVVWGGLSVRPVLRSLWMERSLSIFSESRSWGGWNLRVQIKPVARLCG